MRKLITILTVIMLAVTLSVAGTLAFDYTLNQDAAQHKHVITHQMKDGHGVALMPALELNPGDTFDWSSPGVLDKSVTVTNSSDDDCYFRLVLAFENNGSLFTNGGIVTDLATDGQFDVTYAGGVTVGGEPYEVYVVTGKDLLGAGQSITVPMNIAVRSWITGKDIEPLGSSYVVLSAVQALWMDETLEEQQYELEEEAFSADMLVKMLGNDYETLLESVVSAQNK